MAKDVGTVTAKQFGMLYIEGVPYNPKNVKRFLTKGSGVKVQDIVIFEPEESTGEGARVLSYLKNAIYAEGKEEAMVNHYHRTREYKVAKMSDFSDVSDDIKRELKEEGIVITNDGVFRTPAEENMAAPNETPTEEEIITEIDEKVLEGLHPDQKRTLSILLQSSLKVAADYNMMNTPEGQPVNIDKIKADALDLVYWIDRNSTQMFNY